jgi:hypothetical protein
MTSPTFQVTSVRAERHAVVPTLVFSLKAGDETEVGFRHIALRSQIRVEPQRRSYSPTEEDKLIELFGEATRWGQTLRPFLWMEVSLSVRLDARGELELAVPCTYDFEVVAAKYLHSLDAGEVPLRFLFSGTVFSDAGDGVRVSQIPWDREATYRMPVQVWRQLMDQYFPDAGWLRLRRETLDALLEIKGRRGLTTWDEVISSLLPAVKERKCLNMLAK